MIKYLGSKRLLVGAIVDVLGKLRAAGLPTDTVADLFSGTSRVGQALKRAGHRVIANDHNAYAHTLATCYVQADRETHLDAATRLLAELDTLPPAPGYFTRTFCEEARFFRPENGARVDAIRDRIAALSLDPELGAIALVSLMEAADRVDSTTGVHMAFLKQWAPRAANRLTLRLPELLPRAPAGPGLALQLDAAVAAREVEADVAYLDPPYNQHKYLGNYHIWETLVRWDHPEVYGVARKRIDCKERRSPFNSKRQIAAALEDVVVAARCTSLVVSFSNEGFLSRADIERILSRRGHVTVLAFDHRRYVGARIGVFNPSGARVGEVSHLDNVEYLYVVTPEPVPALAEVPGALSV